MEETKLKLRKYLVSYEELEDKLGLKGRIKFVYDDFITGKNHVISIETEDKD